MSLDSNEKFKFLFIYFKIFKTFQNFSLKTQNFIFEISLKFLQTCQNTVKFLIHFKCSTFSQNNLKINKIFLKFSEISKIL